jgi:FtsZ-binding cell division protein ZapB
MDSRTEERVKDWDSRPFSAGYEDLRDLADDEFSGAVEAAGATLFMLNGRVVGIPGGDMASFEDASGTIYEAPDPSLPLLFAMREQGGDERAKYYTNDTPISEADGTLSSGTFTGYIELSENVLSGDYYVVYYGGRSMSCAFVGNSEQLITGDEAFDRADDEVGIYTVWDVDVEVTDIPDPAGEDDEVAGAGATGGAGAGAAGAGAAGAGTAAGGTDEGSVNDPVPSGGVDEPVDDAVGASEHESVDATSAAGAAGSADRRTDETVRDAADDAVAAPPADDDTVDHDDPSVVEEAEPGGGGRSTDDVDDGRRTGARTDESTTESPREDVRDAERGDARNGDRGGSPQSGRTGRSGDGTDRRPSENRTDDSDGGAMAEVPDEVMAEVEDEAQTTDLAEEMAWRETTTIPSINPDRTTESEPEDPLASASSGSSRSSEASNSRSSGTQNASQTRTENGGTERTRTKGGNRSQGPSGRTGGGGGVDPERVQAIEDELDDVREERDAIASERDELEVERDELRERNRELQSRVEDLEGEVRDLESELADVRERLAAEESAGTNAGVELTPRDALEGTNLFVRYGSKSATTMDDVHDRDVGIADLESNLRLEYHTGFDAADAVVDGQPYDDFLYDSTPYRFVEWFVYDLVFEVRDTGNESALGDLYDAFPKVDRIELYGDVSLRYEEDGKEQREQTTFDVVVRDRMGNPLAVANVNDGRDPATEDMMVDLQERASRVKRTSDALAGAFMVTASYFEPGALETAEEATSGSLLRRDSKKSYVKLSRKTGYHLCLVETRNGEFHVNVPEL